MGYNNCFFGRSPRYSDSYGYDNNNYGCGNYSKDDNNDCGCDEFFKNISRGEDVKVFLKGGGHVFGEFIDVRGNLVFLAKAECHRHDDCCDKKGRVRITTICCDDIVAVEV
ncbi:MULTISPECIES: hypothetical protein [Cytobacillus]|uniref:Uncharacterized protein n=1 Tax=Cytobacillus stercorigallinarum TaxID=2762240 RepID=A0ABR8QM79_9BACI|nr:hypothetical protein [Cytobacillus stercorigallinarum]MBD7936628.1 hypothetical protein [Cytobacillus stercorigallinarum]